MRVLFKDNTDPIISPEPNLRQRFMSAIEKGELGREDERGIIVTSKEFRMYFWDVNISYAITFLPAATIEPGRTRITNTRYLFRLRKGVYLLHPDLFINA